MENVCITITNNISLKQFASSGHGLICVSLPGEGGLNAEKVFLPTVAPFLLDFALCKMSPTKYAYGSGCEYNYEF